MLSKLKDLLFRFRQWLAARGLVKPVDSFGALPPADTMRTAGGMPWSYWLSDEVIGYQMQLLDRAQAFELFGLPLLPEPADPTDAARPKVPTEEEGQGGAHGFTVVYLRAPQSQEAGLLEFGGFGAPPAFDFDVSPTNRAHCLARKFLTQLQVDGVIESWYAFPDEGGVGVHVRMHCTQAAAFYSLMDWNRKIASTALQKKDKHGWG